jgi:hypothetical protein
LTKYYGVGYVSYVDVVRDIVHRNTKERTFSPEGWYDEKHPDIMLREVHPPMGMAIASSFIISYYLLTLFMSQNDLKPYYEQYHHNHNTNPHFTRLTTQPEGDTTLLPPLLDRSLLLQDVSKKYYDETTAERRQCDVKSRRRRKCPISFLNGISKGYDSVNETMGYFQPYIVNPGNNTTGNHSEPEWEWFNLGGKKRARYGFVPVPIPDKKMTGRMGHGTNRTLTLEFHEEEEPIKTVTIFYFTKNNTKWMGTELTVSIYSFEDDATTKENGHEEVTPTTASSSSRPVLIAESKLSCYAPNKLINDDKFQEVIQLDPPQRHFQVQWRHTGGETFRVTGFAICH